MPGINYPPEIVGQIVEAARHESYEAVRIRFNCSKSTVSRLVKKHRETGTAVSPPRPGRPSLLTPRDQMHVQRILLKYNTLSPSNVLDVLHKLGYSFSLSSLHRYMRDLGLGRYVAREKPFLSPRVRGLRRGYASKRSKDSLDKWRRTICVDEVPARLGGSCKTFVTRKKGEAYRERNMVPKLQINGVSFMLWGGIWWGGRTELIRLDCSDSEGKKGGVTAKIYRDQVTKGPLNVAWKRVKNNWRGYGTPRILEDNAPVHTAAVNRIIGAEQGFRYLDHPPNLPDLNPIENVWAILKRRNQKLARKPSSADGMFEELRRIWWEIPQETIDLLIDSMPKRIEAVRRARGFATKY